MDKEKTTPTEEIIEETEQDALSSYLETSKENLKSIKDKKPKKAKKSLMALWIILAAIAVIGIIVAIVILSKDKPFTFADLKDSIPMEHYTDNDGQHQAKPVLDKNGKLDTESYKPDGVLIEKMPSDIKQIDIKNDSGSFTLFAETPLTTDPDTGETVRDTTVYTLKGYEDISLQSGEPDTIANDCAAISFKRIADVSGEKAAQFGFDSSSPVIKTYFTDGTYSTVTVGDKAPNNDGTYLMFGSNKTIYLVDNTAIDGFIFSVLDLMPLDITDAASSITDSEFKSISISGSAFSDTIELKPNTDPAISSSCVMTAPFTMFVNEVEVSNIEGAIRGLYASEVICINPSNDQLKSFGLSDPYAKLTAKYPDKTITLKASAPKDGYVNLIADSSDLVYKMEVSKLPWVQTSTTKLIPSVVISTNYPAISKITVTDSSGTYTINAKTTSDTVQNSNGYTETIYYTTASYNDLQLTEDNFRIFCQNINNMANKGNLDSTKKGKTALTITISYATGRSSDTIKVYETEGTKYIAELNSRPMCFVNKSYCSYFSVNVQALISGNTVGSI